MINFFVHGITLFIIAVTALLLSSCGKPEQATMLSQEQKIITSKYEYEFHLSVENLSNDSHVLEKSLKFEVPDYITAEFSGEYTGNLAQSKLVIHGIGECYYEGIPTVEVQRQYLTSCVGFTQNQVVPAGTVIELISLDEFYVSGWCWYQDNDRMFSM